MIAMRLLSGFLDWWIYGGGFVCLFGCGGIFIWEGYICRALVGFWGIVVSFAYFLGLGG